MFGLFRKKASPADFWQWLQTNGAQLQSNFKTRPQKVAKEIGRAFERSYPKLSWEVGPEEPGPWVFCISADGNRDLFPEVIQAVEAAPVIPGWNVRAFRGRGDLDSTMEIGEMKLSYNDVWCGVIERLEDGVRLMLCIRGLTKESETALTQAALIMLDNAVGEYDAVMKIKELGRDRLPDNPQRQENFFPLSELPGYLDRLAGTPSPD